LLKDPARRRALDDSIRARLATKERYDAHNAKRKQLIDELEGNERAVKRQRETRNREHNAEEDELTRIKMQSQQLRQARASTHKSPTRPPDSQENSLGAL
jgi:ClpP class serine protease